MPNTVDRKTLIELTRSIPEMNKQLMELERKTVPTFLTTLKKDQLMNRFDIDRHSRLLQVFLIPVSALVMLQFFLKAAIIANVGSLQVNKSLMETSTFIIDMMIFFFFASGVPIVRNSYQTSRNTMKFVNDYNNADLCDNNITNENIITAFEKTYSLRVVPPAEFLCVISCRVMTNPCYIEIKVNETWKTLDGKYEEDNLHRSMKTNGNLIPQTGERYHRDKYRIVPDAITKRAIIEYMENLIRVQHADQGLPMKEGHSHHRLHKLLHLIH